TVHLSAHGSFRDDNPAFSRITTGDGALFLADIQEKRLRAELVVLSACDTGLTFTGRGDDVTGVALGFLGAGARSLVASQWRAHDKASRRIMEALYEEYASRGSRDVPAALAAAGRAVREDWNHPLYWAAFAAYGR
ncbi:MAG: CHAT domain-containing protein, partial [Gemmatimonadota bacterium]|nr:CHAT domain-containing protein [Gemmatimonadota bacterium]